MSNSIQSPDSNIHWTWSIDDAAIGWLTLDQRHSSANVLSRAVMEELGLRRAELENMVPDGKGRIRLEFMVPARGLIGFRSMFLTMTSFALVLVRVVRLEWLRLRPGKGHRRARFEWGAAWEGNWLAP